MTSTYSNIPPPLREEQSEFTPLWSPKRHSVVRKGDGPAAIVALLGLLALVAFTWTLILTNKPKELGLFAFHPLIQTIAISCFTLGILTLQRTHLDDPEGKKKGQARHQFFMILFALPLIVAGVILMITHKETQGWKHFTTWHARFGLTVISWLVIQAFVGAGSIWFGGRLFGGGDKATRVYKYHRISGYMVFTLMLVTVHLSGAWSSWTISHTSLLQRALFYFVAPVMIFGGVIWRIRFEKMKFWGE